MSKEVKESIVKIYEAIKDKELVYFDAMQKTIDYITDLQQELKEEKRIEEVDLKTIQRLEEENERLKEEKQLIESDINNSYSWLEDYKSRCKKAIEYIKEHIRIDDEYPDYMEMLVEERDNLLNILQNGSDDNE